MYAFLTVEELMREGEADAGVGNCREGLMLYNKALSLLEYTVRRKTTNENHNKIIV